jgi:hypothetical protein
VRCSGTGIAPLPKSDGLISHAGSNPALTAIFVRSDAVSSNGRTEDFESSDAGSNPAAAAKLDKAVRLTWAELQALPEYSCSLPSGTYVGKRWKRNINAYARPHADDCTAPHEKTTRGIVCPCIQAFSNRCPQCVAVGKNLKPNWWLGEYVDDPDPKQIGIVWTRILVRPPRS